MTNSLRKIGDRASLYLPLLLMALFAMGTWWLVSNAPKTVHSTAAQVPAEVPDYTMDHFAVHQFNRSGQLTSEITGTNAKHLPINDTLEVAMLRTRNWSPNGMLTTASARRGISNADASEVQLWEDAVVRRTFAATAKPAPDMVLQGEFLHAWTNEEQLRSHLPVTMQRGKDQFSANSMAYDNLSQVLQLKGRVKGVLYPGHTSR